MMEQDRKEYLDKDESEKMCSSKIGEAGEMCSPADTDTCRSRVLSTSGEFVEVLNFREDNEESSEETTGCKASVYAEFDECTRSENFIEILRFRQFARYMSFTPTGKQGKKKQIMNGIEVSVVLHLV